MGNHAEVRRLEAVPSTGALTRFDLGVQTAKTPHLAGLMFTNNSTQKKMLVARNKLKIKADYRPIGLC